MVFFYHPQAHSISFLCSMQFVSLLKNPDSDRSLIEQLSVRSDSPISHIDARGLPLEYRLVYAALSYLCRLPRVIHLAKNKICAYGKTCGKYTTEPLQAQSFGQIVFY
ncbi:unnamed protein product [Periconia digitata]|uniref:Uncharacterized protein n=1 Tax=Periconia digitata TaxID=1303443 RepID=A0A9W4UMR3_9PLEO|nr:unnamed protein product [Periconia digitata]